MRIGCPPETEATYQAVPITWVGWTALEAEGSKLAYRRRLASGDQIGLVLERSPVRSSVRSPPSARARNTALVNSLGPPISGSVNDSRCPSGEYRGWLAF